MSDRIFSHKGGEVFIEKMGALITNNRPRIAKTSKNITLKKLDHNFVVIGLGGYRFHPLGHVVHCHKNICVPMRTRKRTHEVYPPNIKHLHNKDGGQGHHITARNIAGFLAPKACLAKLISILKQSGPVETAL
jgi:hypothetical protein